jgi:hypothetical protein
MNRKDKHIDKYLNTSLPDPEIGADDAWAGMNDMLNVPITEGARPQSDQGHFSQIWKSVTKIKGMLFAAAAATTLATGVAWFASQTNSTDSKKDKQNTVSINTPELPTNEPDKSSKPDADTLALKAPSNPTGKPGKILTDGPFEKDDSNHFRTDHTETNRTRELAEIKTHPTVAHAGVTHAGTTHSGRTETRDANAPIGTRQNRRNAPLNLWNALASPASDLSASPSLAFPVNEGERPAKKAIYPIEPIHGHFQGTKNDLTSLVKKPKLNAPQPTAKPTRSFLKGIHFGPEWSVSAPFAGSPYQFTGLDSVKRPARLAVPGLFISKNWRKHTVTAIFTPLHSYFGNNQRVAQKIDTIRMSDSTFNIFYNNTKFIKATGMNFTLQYQYEATSWFSATAGLSYARFSGALLRKETENGIGDIIPGMLIGAKSQESMKGFINPQQWTIRGGMLFHPPFALKGRLQIGGNVMLPISNLAQDPGYNVKSINGQVFLRLLVR